MEQQSKSLSGGNLMSAQIAKDLHAPVEQLIWPLEDDEPETAGAEVKCEHPLDVEVHGVRQARRSASQASFRAILYACLLLASFSGSSDASLSMRACISPAIDSRMPAKRSPAGMP